MKRYHKAQHERRAFLSYNNKPLSVRRSERKTRNRFVLTILVGLFFLYALIAWILPAMIGGLSVVNNFKDQPEKEIPVSENATLAPPVLSIPFEATASSSINIGGYAIPNSTVEIYLDDELKATTNTKEDGSFLAESIGLSIGINNISGKAIDDKKQRSLSSKPIRILYDNEKPKLEVSEPSDGKTVTEKRITVSGITDPEDIVISINGTRAIVNSEGKFSSSIELNEGDNDIVIKAINLAGNSTQISRKVTYTSNPTPTPTP